MRVTAKTAEAASAPPTPDATPLTAADPSAASPEPSPATSYDRLMGGEDLLETPGSQPQGPFRGGQSGRGDTSGTATEIGTTRRAEVTQSIAVNERNMEFMSRLDRNGDGVLQHGEVRTQLHRAGTTRIRNESAGMSQDDRNRLTQLYRGTGNPISLTYDGGQIGAGEGQSSWQAVERGLARGSASQNAPLGTVGQSRPSNLDNNNCGPASGLYMNDRRVRAATGTAPRRTHAQADRMIRTMAGSSGTTAPQMAGVMNDNFRHAGGRYYTHDVHEVNRDNLSGTLMTGLASDPGGVMVPIISTANEADTSGTRHWIVVTGYDGTNVQYYDPGGPDGAAHERSMPIEELRDALPAPNAISPNQVVYGSSVPESSVAGALPVGRRIGELEVRFLNRDLNVSSTHGVYGSRADAQRAARSAAAATGEDAVVRREGDAYAVYGVTEIRDQFGGLWSDNTLADLDSGLTDVYMTDPTSGSVRRATSGPPP